MPYLVLPCPCAPPVFYVLMPNGNTKRVSPPYPVHALLTFVDIFPQLFFGHKPPLGLLELTYIIIIQQIKMQIYFLLAAIFPTVLLGSPLENFISFLPQDDLAPNPDHITYSDALQSQNSNDQTFEAFAVPEQQQTWPNYAYDVALAPNSQVEKVDDETARYRAFKCQEGYSVCCQGSDRSRSSQHKSCSESKIDSLKLLLLSLFSTLFAKDLFVSPFPLESNNQYAGLEDVGSKDMRYGQYCYNPFYTTECDDRLGKILQVRRREKEKKKINSLLSLSFPLTFTFFFSFLFLFGPENFCKSYNELQGAG